MRLLLLGTALIGTLLAVTIKQRPSEAAAPVRDTPATTYIANADPVTGVPYRIGSDFLGTYQNGVDSVSSIVQGIGNWVLDTKPSPIRRVFVDLSDPVPNTGGAAPFVNGLFPVRFISKCTTNITTLAVGQTTLCPLAISIDYNGGKYALRAAEPPAPGTDYVVWECLARSSSKCVSWTMRPSVFQANGERKMKMTLLRVATRPKDPDVPIGQFYLSFDIAVTTP